MSLGIALVTEYSDELLEALNQLIPQLAPDLDLLTENELTEIIQSSCSHLFVAKENDTIIGCLTLVLYPIPSGMRAWIEDVVVDEKSRGMGTGKNLVKEAIKYAKKFGAISINLTSSPSRIAANALYQKLGFKLRETNVYRHQK